MSLNTDKLNGLDTSPSRAAAGSGLRMQVLEDQRWVDVHNRCGLNSLEHAKRIYQRFLRDNKKNPTQPPVCGMRVISVHFEWLGHLPNSVIGPNSDRKD